MSKRAGLALLLCVAAASWAAPAQTREKIVAVKVTTTAESFQPGKTYPVTLEISISPPYHINAEVPSEDYLVGTAVTFTPLADVTYGKPAFPPAEKRRLSFSENALDVYSGTVKVSAEVTLDKGFKGSELAIEGSVSYQACNDQSCLAPEDVAFLRSFPVVSGGPEKEPNPGSLKTAKSRPNSIGPFESAQPYSAVTPGPTVKKRAPEKPAGTTEPKKPAPPFEGRGLPIIFVLVFLGGLGLNLTPCVYPLIPITISYFGGQSEGKRGGLAVHAVLYVVGMAITYSILGVIAAFAGSLFGAALQYPPVLVFIALVMIILALSMFDVYELRLPAFLNRLGGSRPKGYFGTVIMGLTVGIVAAPCIGPFIIGLLTYVGNRGSVVLGFSLFFVLALGLGLPFLFLGIFSGSLGKLPRSGVWMVWVRKIFGFILIAMAVYFLRPLFPNPLLYSLSLGLTMFIAGLYLAWLEPSEPPGKAFRYIRTWVGIAFFGVALGIAGSGVKDYIDEAVARKIEALGAIQTGSDSGSIAWQSYSEQKLAEAGRAGSPIFIDSFADWCIPCRELDNRTFNQPEVIAASRDFVMLKADLTRRTDSVETFYRKYEVRGVPTLIFLKPDGTELTELRGTGFEAKDEFLGKLRRALELARKR